MHLWGACVVENTDQTLIVSTREEEGGNLM